MKIKKLLLIMAGLLLMLPFTACNSEEKTDGGWEDIIKPSTTTPAIDANGGIVSVTTQNEGWWIESIEVNGKTIQPEYTSHSFNTEYITVDADWLTVERTDGKTLKLSAKKNVTNKKTTAVIYLQAGNYFGTIVVNQEPASASTVKLLPATITTTSGSLGTAYHSNQSNRFSYDNQYRISTITRQIWSAGVDMDMPLSVSTFEYGNNTITVTETITLDFDPDYVPTTTVTVYEIKGNKVYVNDADPIDIDDKGRALNYNQKYDDNGNVISYDNWGERNLTVEYDNMNGVFRHVNMPSWYLTIYAKILSYPGCFLYNNATVAWHTQTMDKDLPAGYGFEIEYNEYDYPVHVGERQINYISNGYGSFTVDYVSYDARNHGS